MKIKELYPMLTYDHEISSIVHHSQEVYENAVFVAIVGYNHDGHDFIFEAIAKGAKTIIHEKEWFYPFPQNVNFHRVENAQKELAWLLQQVYSSIWDDLTVIGITGTNGKTTVSTMVYHYLTYLDYPTLLIGSNGCKYVDYYWPWLIPSRYSNYLSFGKTMQSQIKICNYRSQQSSHSGTPDPRNPV